MPFCCLCFFWGSCSLFLSLSFLLAFFTEWGMRMWVEAPCRQASLRWVRGKLRLWLERLSMVRMSISAVIFPEQFHFSKECLLLLERKAMTNLDNIFKSRDITLSTKVHLIKAIVFPVVMYGCESWTIKKADCQRSDAFQLWCWRRLLRVPWKARRSNQSILKEISPRFSLEELMLKLRLQYFGHLMQRADSFEKILMLGKIEGRRKGDNRGWDGWMASRTQWTWVWVNSRSWCWTGRPGMLWFMGSQRVGHDWVTELNWTEGRVL